MARIRDGKIAADARATPGREIRGRRRGRRFVGNSENQIRIRTQAQPNPLLARQRASVEIAGDIQHVEDHLHVHVRPPAAVLLRRADFSKTFALRNVLADPKPRQRCAAQMTVQRIERRASRVVPENHNRPVIERMIRVLKAVDHAVRKRMHASAGCSREIHAEVNTARLVERIRARKRRGYIQRSRLTVASDAKRHARRLQPLPQRTRTIAFGLATHQWTPDAHVDPLQLAFDHWRERVCGQPRAHSRSMRNRFKTAGLAQHVPGEAWMDPSQHRQRRANRLLADAEVRIAGTFRLLLCGKAGTHAQTHARESKHRLNLHIR